jgi:pilus assembly protein CpaB
MNRKLTGLAAAAVLALVGTLILVGYVRSAEARALAGEELVEVLIVTDAVDAGTSVDDLADHVKTEQVPAKARAEGALSELDAVEGKVTAVRLLPGEQLLADRFVASVSRSQVPVPSGLLEVTVSLEPHRAVGGQLRPGDTVGVLASFDDLGDGEPVSHLMLHKVLVTSIQVGTAIDEDDEDKTKLAPKGSLLVTLALDAHSVERVVFAAEHGRLWLSAEPAEATETGSAPVKKASVFA